MGEEATPPPRRGGSFGLIKAGIIVLICLLGIGLAIWFLAPPKEPSYQGKSLSYWLEQGLGVSGPEDPKDAKCREAFSHMGTNVIPFLLRRLQAKDSVLKEKFANLADRQDFVHFRLTSVEDQKYTVRDGFHWLGDLASNAIPGLVRIYSNPPSPPSKWIASECLVRLYPLPGADQPYWLPPEEQADWFLNAGNFRYAAEDFTNAAAAFSQAIRLDPTNVSGFLARGQVLIQMKDLEGAFADVAQAMQLDPSNYLAFSLQGSCEFSAKDYPSAEASFTRAINLDTNSWENYHGRGMARANLRKFDDALADLNLAIKMAPDNAETFRNRSLVYQSMKKYELALEDVSRAIKLDDKDPVVYVSRGGIEASLRNYRAAVADFDKAIALKPDESFFYGFRAGSEVALNDFTNAAADLEKALALNPANPQALFVRGWMKTKQGRPNEEVLVDTQRAVELMPLHPEARGYLGVQQYKASQWGEAQANCRRALAMKPMSSAEDFLACLWVIRGQSGELKAGNEELTKYLESLDDSKTNEWHAIVARFFTGGCPETNLLALAITSAERTNFVPCRICDALYYAAMKRKIEGDRSGAAELFQKCLATKYDNSINYYLTLDEVRAAGSTK